MQSRGFSLIEMLVVTGIVSFLLVIGTLRFAEYLTRYRIEAQMRSIYSSILEARAAALYERRTTRVKLYPGLLELYSSVRDKADGANPIRTRVLDHAVACNGSGDEVSGYRVDFDPRGLAANACSIWLNPGHAPATVDLVVISRTRVRIGKRGQVDESNP